MVAKTIKGKIIFFSTPSTMFLDDSHENTVRIDCSYKKYIFKNFGHEIMNVFNILINVKFRQFTFQCAHHK